MARIPSDPYDPNCPAGTGYDTGPDTRLEREAQFDPELTEGRASAGKMAPIRSRHFRVS